MGEISASTDRKGAHRTGLSCESGGGSSHPYLAGREKRRLIHASCC